MFTGIIEEVGTIKKIRMGTVSAELTIGAKLVLTDVHIGDSIAVNGVCLTVTSFTQALFTADMMRETLRRSSLGTLRAGSSVNLERAMRADGRFGGHIVAGHVDGIGTISAIRQDDNAIWYTVRTTPRIMRYIVEKGSVTVDGISLTVAIVGEDYFCVSVIPHTASQTNLSGKRMGDKVNLENDCIGKYVEKLLVTPREYRETSQGTGGITEEFLTRNGF